MPSNSEMFERGIHDAEHDELNPFYYQHYYSYRQGYDRARRLVRSGGRPPIAALFGFAALLALLGLGGWWLFSGGFGAPQAAEATAPTIAAATAPPTSPAPRPTAPPAPTLAPLPAPSLTPGAQAVVVNLNGAPLRARQQPGLTPIVARIPEGSTVTLREGPVEADGYTWWRVEAPNSVVGWVAQASPEGVTFLEPLP